MNPANELFIRISSFVRKEMAEILRQPKLVATLILGPFLILLIFGVGYNNSSRAIRAVMVIPEDSKIENEIKEIAGRLGGAVNLLDFVSSLTVAEEMLAADQVDLIFVTPADPLGDVLANQQAQMEILHHEIDPLEKMFINSLERAYVEEVNRLVWIRTLDRAKENSEQTLAKTGEAQTDAQRLHADLAAGNSEAAAADIAALAADFREINQSVNNSLAAFEGIQTLTEEETAVSPIESLLRAEQLMSELEEFDSEKGDYSRELELVDSLERELDLVADFLAQFNAVDSQVLARPFSGKTVTLLTVDFGPIDFYVPGVISLLLQHIAVTLAALAIVREVAGGSIELFRAAPISAFETLLGKTISFLLLAGFLAAVLTLLVILGLNVPMLGSWFAYTAIILALLYSSLGMGFAISTISETDSQAVQYSMIVLLASIFFSGFFIALYRLLPGVHIVSWLLPATYGTAMLQDVMLRGLAPQPLLLLGLIVYGFLWYMFAWWRLRHLMARE